jgi:predicted Zn-dependent peptidase
MNRLLIACAALSALALLGAAPPSMTLRPFAPATAQRLPNGVIIASQPQYDLPLIGAQVTVPAGLAQQPADKAGVAAIAAALVLVTPVEGSTTLQNAVESTGGEISYTLDPLDTRFYLECRSDDYARLIHDLRIALANPDVSQTELQRAKTLGSARSMSQNPIETAYAMVRQVNYSGNGFALPDQGSPLTIAKLSRADVAAFAAMYQRGSGTVVALEGAASQAVVDASAREFGTFPSGAAASAPAAKRIDRTHQVVAHRSVAAPWIAVAYQAPDQYSADFAAMLVVESLLGGSGGIDSFAFSSASPAPDDYVGAYYEYDASPGSMIVFLGGADSNLDESMRDLETGIARLRGDVLSQALVDEAKRSALGDYYSSATTLSGQAWLLGRSVSSPEGLAFENVLPQRILAVKAQDIQRVARRYLTKETIAIVLPAEGQ